MSNTGRHFVARSRLCRFCFFPRYFVNGATATYRTNGDDAHILPPTFVQIAYCQLIPGRVYCKRITERLRSAGHRDADVYLLGKGSVCFQGIDSCLGVLTRSYREHFRDHLERKLNELQLNVDVSHINGSLHKTDKFWWIRLFCDEGHIQEADF
jgi:hypothetical protein